MNNDPDMNPNIDRTPPEPPMPEETPAQAAPEPMSEQAPVITPPTEETQQLEETAAPIETAFATPAKKRSPKMIIAAIIAAAIIVLAGSTVFGYTMWYQNPDKVVHDAVINTIKARTIQSTGTIAYKSDEAQVDITLDGKSDDAKGELNVTAKVTIDTDDMQQDFEAKGAARFVDGTFYVKLTGIKGIVEDVAAQSNGQIPDYAAAMFDKFEDKWVSISPSDYQDINESIAKQQTCVTDLMKKIESDRSMSNEVVQLYRDNQVVIIKEELGAKTINGTGSLGYKVGVNKDAAVAFTKGLDDTTFGKEMKACDADFSFKEIADGISDDTTDNEQVPTVELWVSRFGHEVTQVSVYGDAGDNATLSMMLQPTFNKEVAVEAPSDATPLKTVLEDIQQLMMQQYQEMYSDDSTMQVDFDTELNAALESAI